MKVLTAILNIFLFISPLFAQLSPGDLHESHKHLEGLKNCTKCHDIGKKISQDKCLDCHKILRDRIKAGKGLHSHADFTDCVNCHVEHQGRNFKLIYWKNGRDKFDHSLTGYKLEGKHAEQKCENCHQPKNIRNSAQLKKQNKNLQKTFLGLSQDCLSCHIDEHRNQLSKNCLNCHNYDDWKTAKKFDHNKSNFPLTGKHRDVKCEKCHKRIVDNKYKDNPDYLKFTGLKHLHCIDCHEDVHKNKFGERCESCHKTSGWKNYKLNNFNHDKTKFPLRGKHAQLKCEQCHLPGRPLKIAKFDKCRDCHEDYHQGQFSHRPQRGNCEECHTVEGFAPSLFTVVEHNKSDYQLDGSHLAVPCIECHKKIDSGTPKETIRFRFPAHQCQTCHNNPHWSEVDKYLKKDGCETCHSTENWKISKFDHDSTKFPLLGKHKEATCKDCHKPFFPEKEPAYLKFQKVIKLCQNCHEDIHQGQFRDSEIYKKTSKNFTRCERCHTPVDWLAEKFDHNMDAKFKLEGGHENVPCEQCHLKKKVENKEISIYKPVSTECKFCHIKN